MKRIYCYIDESGQDIKSEIFVVVAVAIVKDLSNTKEQIIKIENLTQIYKRKWHKSRSQNKYLFLQKMIEMNVAKGDIYYGKFKKPIPYFLPIIDTLEKAILAKHLTNYQATVYIDGIDKKKSAELTNALRTRDIKLKFIKSCRDESEPLIRVADRWAGCIRGAFLNKKDDLKCFAEAKRIDYLINIQKQ